MTDDVGGDSGGRPAPPVEGVGGPGPGDFTEEAARGFIGRRYRSTARYSGVEPGSIGTVCDIYSRGGGRFGVDVFTGGPNKGRRAMVPLDGPDGLECDPAPPTVGDWAARAGREVASTAGLAVSVPINGGGCSRASLDLGAIRDWVAERRRQFPSELAVFADLDELTCEVERYQDLCLRLTLGAGPYAGQPLLGGSRTPDYLGSGVGALSGHYCIWCGAIREADDRHSADCPWPEVLKEARGAVYTVAVDRVSDGDSVGVRLSVADWCQVVAILDGWARSQAEGVEVAIPAHLADAIAEQLPQQAVDACIQGVIDRLGDGRQVER